MVKHIAKKRKNSLSEIINEPDAGDMLAITKRCAITAETIPVDIPMMELISFGSNTKVINAMKKIRRSGIKMVMMCRIPSRTKSIENTIRG